jgi:hypothetical protein
MQPGTSAAAHRHRNNDEDDDFEDEQPLLEPFTQLSLDNVSTSKFFCCNACNWPWLLMIF